MKLQHVVCGVEHERDEPPEEGEPIYCPQCNDTDSDLRFRFLVDEAKDDDE